jgi:hypothetical protein
MCCFVAQEVARTPWQCRFEIVAGAQKAEVVALSWVNQSTVGSIQHALMHTIAYRSAKARLQVAKPALIFE